MKRLVRVARGRKPKVDLTPATASVLNLDARVDMIQALIPLGLQAVEADLLQAVVELAGPRYQRSPDDRQFHRWGSENGCEEDNRFLQEREDHILFGSREEAAHHRIHFGSGQRERVDGRQRLVAAPSGEPVDFANQRAAEVVAYTPALFAGIPTAMMLTWWIFRITPAWVRTAADAYAFRLLETCELLQPKRS